MMQANEQNKNVSSRLCEAIKWHPCLYDSKSRVYQMKHAVDAAWRSIANECEDTVVNCKNRWNVISKSFATSVRRYGNNNRHYLSDYLDFLVPHVNSININDDNAKGEGKGSIQISERAVDENEEGHEDDDDDDEDKDQDWDDHDEADDDEDYEEDGEHNTPEEFEGHDSDTTTAEETARERSARQRKAKSAALATENEDTDNLYGDCNTDGSSRQSRRIIRLRKAPKRFLDTEMYGRSSANQEEKRARRSAERKKSTGLEDYDKRKSTTNLPETDKRKSEESDKRKTLAVVEELDKRKPIPNLANKRVEVKLIKTKLMDPATIEPKRTKANSPDKLRSTSTDKIRTFFVKTDKTSANNDSSVKISRPIKIDRSSPQLETAKKAVNRGTQCDTDVPKTMDEEFLDTLKPQMELMNSRQKFNFKRRIYQALMDVFDDGTNFPNRDEIVELPPNGAPRFDNTTVGELRLMRELVQLVQAAKLTPEIMEANEKAVAPVDSSPSPTPPPTEKALCHTTGLMINERKSNSPTGGERITKRSETLGLPRHILQKVVKVAGSNGGTILAHEGEKRRVYRIYPKGTLPPSVAHSAASSASIGTFYVTPPKSTIASSGQSKVLASSGGIAGGKPIIFNGKVVNHLNSANQPIQSNANASSNSMSNNAVMRHKVTIRTQPTSGMIGQRRLSQSVTANSDNSNVLLQNKNITSTNQSKTTPTNTRIGQRVSAAWDETGKSSTGTGLSQIQISQAISLNTSANISKSSVKSFLESGADSEKAGQTSPNTILPDGGMAEDEGTADTGYDPLFIKTKIKDEPSE